MYFPFTKSNSRKIVAIFDVGSDSIGAVIVQYPSPDQPPKILKTFREDIIFRDNLDFVVFMDDMIKTLKLVTLRASLSGVGTIDDIHIVLSSPWYVSENRHLFVLEPNPFIFTDKLSNDLVNKEIEKIKKTNHDKYGGNLDSIDIIEKEIIQVSLNGYVTADPLGKKASQVDINMLVTFSSGTCLKLIKDCFYSVFHDIPLYFHSNMSSLFLVIREKYSKMDDYLILDIGGELTDIFIIEDGIPKNILSFPCGRQSIYRELKKETKKSRAELVSLFSLYLDGALESKEKEKFNVALEKARKSWILEFESAISSIPEPRMIPNSIILLINKDIHPWFFSMFSERNESIYRIFKNDCNVLGLNGPDFLGLCKIQDGNCDPMLMIQVLSVKKKYIK